MFVLSINEINRYLFIILLQMKYNLNEIRILNTYDKYFLNYFLKKCWDRLISAIRNKTWCPAKKKKVFLSILEYFS